jgi:hypothetical protein
MLGCRVKRAVEELACRRVEPLPIIPEAAHYPTRAKSIIALQA